jgi:L-alanine-DL-glutamate epimerase-like enolase superfamily enzyme
MIEPTSARRSPGTTIARVDAFPILYPTVGRFKFFEGTHGQRSGRASVIVKLTAEDGTVGWGQSVPIPKWSYETLESVHSTITRHLAPEIVGLDATDLPALHALMDRVIAPSFSTGQPIAKAGIDLAAHDLAGRSLQRSAADAWPRRGADGLQHITLSWTLNPKTLDDVEPMIEQGKARGYRHFNVKVAPDPAYDLELCRIVKKAAPDGFLWADANGGYDLPTALDVAPKLADLGVAVLEQPVASNRLSGFKALKDLGALPILMDEGVVSSVELEEFHRLGLLDGLAMKPARCGGLLDAYRQCDFCRNHGLMLLGSGLTDPDLSLAASLLLYGAFRLDGPAALNGPQFLEGSILKDPLAFSPETGTMAVPRGPGLGVEVDEAKLAPLRVEGLD